MFSLLLLVAALSSCTTAPAEQATDAAPAASPPEVAAATSQPRPSSEPPSDPSPSSNPDPEATTSEQELPVSVDALVERFTIEVSNGTVEPRDIDLQVPVGDTIELAITTDEAATLRAAELGMAHDVPADEETVVPITVKQAGRFEITLGGVLIALITAS
jgi:heme/copper-type cytochrome/quinol oxidase subunit 2